MPNRCGMDPQQIVLVTAEKLPRRHQRVPAREGIYLAVNGSGNQEMAHIVALNAFVVCRAVGSICPGA